MGTEVKVDASLAEKLGLTEDEFNRVLELLGRVPNFTELGVFSAMWSEHCSYKNSRKLFKLFPTKGPQVLVGAGEENSGVVDIGDGWGVSFKMESHNHPSAVKPFEASATGLGGCMRDIFTMGARPLAALASLRFGCLENNPKVQWLYKEVIRGLAHYGNTAKINVVGGETEFDESYEGNPLVNAFVLGIVRNENIVKGAATGAGNAVYYIGKDTGRDGVGGAGFASKEITEDSGEEKGAVAIGDPELGLRLRQACLELIEKRLVVGMQDMGAAGLTCSTCETAARSGAGIEIDVALVPCSEKGMTPYEVLLSESQERMLAILNKENEAAALEVLRRWKVNAVKVGQVTDDGLMRVLENGRVVCEIPPAALTEHAPLYDRETCEPAYLRKVQQLDRAALPEPEDFNQALLQLLDSPTIADKESAAKAFTFREEDVVVVGSGSDAAVVKVPGTKKALAITVDCNNRYCYLNPYQGAMMAVAEAARNIVCSGGKPLAITDGLNFGNPMKPENYWQFVKCIEGLAEACRAFGTPVVSGNVSFYNENPKGAINPTPMVGMVGLIDDVDKHVTQEFKREGDAIVLLGACQPDLSGSEYLWLEHGLKQGNPKIDLAAEKAVQQVVLEAINVGMLHSAHDCSEGGLAVAITESSISRAERMLGAEISLDALQTGGIRLDEILFGEAQSRIVVSLPQDKAPELCKLAQKHNTPCVKLGQVGGDKLIVRVSGRTIIDQPLTKLSAAWRNAIPRRLA